MGNVQESASDTTSFTVNSSQYSGVSFGASVDSYDDESPMHNRRVHVRQDAQRREVYELPLSSNGNNALSGAATNPPCPNSRPRFRTPDVIDLGTVRSTDIPKAPRRIYRKLCDDESPSHNRGVAVSQQDAQKREAGELPVSSNGSNALSGAPNNPSCPNSRSRIRVQEIIDLGTVHSTHVTKTPRRICRATTPQQFLPHPSNDTSEDITPCASGSTPLLSSFVENGLPDAQHFESIGKQRIRQNPLQLSELPPFEAPKEVTYRSNNPDPSQVVFVEQRPATDRGAFPVDNRRRFPETFVSSEFVSVPQTPQIERRIGKEQSVVLRRLSAMETTDATTAGWGYDSIPTRVIDRAIESESLYPSKALTERLLIPREVPQNSYTSLTMVSVLCATLWICCGGLQQTILLNKLWKGDQGDDSDDDYLDPRAVPFLFAQGTQGIGAIIGLTICCICWFIFRYDSLRSNADLTYAKSVHQSASVSVLQASSPLASEHGWCSPPLQQRPRGYEKPAHLVVYPNQSEMDLTGSIPLPYFPQAMSRVERDESVGPSEGSLESITPPRFMEAVICAVLLSIARWLWLLGCQSPEMLDPKHALLFLLFSPLVSIVSGILDFQWIWQEVCLSWGCMLSAVGVLYFATPADSNEAWNDGNALPLQAWPIGPLGFPFLQQPGEQVVLDPRWCVFCSGVCYSIFVVLGARNLRHCRSSLRQFSLKSLLTPIILQFLAAILVAAAEAVIWIISQDGDQPDEMKLGTVGQISWYLQSLQVAMNWSMILPALAITTPTFVATTHLFGVVIGWAVSLCYGSAIINSLQCLCVASFLLNFGGLTFLQVVCPTPTF